MNGKLFALAVVFIAIADVLFFRWAVRRWSAFSAHPILAAVLAGILCILAIALVFFLLPRRKAQISRRLSTTAHGDVSARPPLASGGRPLRAPKSPHDASSHQINRVRPPQAAPPPAPPPATPAPMPKPSASDNLPMPAPDDDLPASASAAPAQTTRNVFRDRWLTIQRESVPSNLTHTGTLAYASPEIVRQAGFISYFPRVIQPAEWNTLLAYIFSPGAIIGVASDARRHFEGTKKDVTSSLSPNFAFIKPGTSVLIVPQSDTLEFDPPQLTLVFFEDFHRAEFRFRALRSVSSTVPLRARISFYIPPLLIGEIDFSVIALEQEPAPLDPPTPAHAEATPYQRIFVSYSHDDSEVADSLERAYKALGNEYLRDIDILRSGEEWNPALLRHIDEAEIFQLLWSQSAGESPYVRQEWQHALSLQRKQFIRPVYWKLPMPAPPPELASIHFAYVVL